MLIDRDKALLYRELAKLSGAGFPLNKAAEAILDTQPPSRQVYFLEEVKAGIEAGNSLSKTISSFSSGLSSLEFSLIRAAEKAGQIPEIFGHLSRYFELRHKAAKKIRAGLIYPVVLLHFAIILPALPKAAQSRDFNGEAINVIMILFTIYFICAICYFAFLTLGKRAARSAVLDTFLHKIPLIGKVRHSFAMSRFAEVLRIHLISGHSASESIRAAAEASASGRILASAEDKILPTVHSGNPAGPILAAERNSFPPAFARAYITGEESGTLDVELARWSIAFADDAQSYIKRMSVVLPKVAYILIVMAVIWQIMEMANIYFDTFEQLMDR